jgi:hypothetical protein
MPTGEHHDDFAAKTLLIELERASQLPLKLS